MQHSLHSPQYAAFLVALRAAREAAAVTQVELAERLAVTQGVISKSERGARRIDVVELIEWLVALGVDPGDFVSKMAGRLVQPGRRGRLAQRLSRRRKVTR